MNFFVNCDFFSTIWVLVRSNAATDPPTNDRTITGIAGATGDSEFPANRVNEASCCKQGIADWRVRARASQRARIIIERSEEIGRAAK